MNITQNHIVEFMALATSVIFWNDLKKGKLRWLPHFLLFILLVELTGNYFKKIPYANYKLYDFTIPIEYLFYFFLFYLHGGKRLRTFCKIAPFVLLIAGLISVATKPLVEIFKDFLIAGEVCVVVCSCIYIYEQFKNAEEESLLTNYFFWIMSGLMLFSLGEMCYFIMFELIHNEQWDKYDELFGSINKKLLILLYLSYIIAIIVHKKYVKPDARQY